MQFTSTIILALLLAVSTSLTVTAAPTSSNLRSGGRKLQEETELNLLRELGACPPFQIYTIDPGDTCGGLGFPGTCDGYVESLECVQAGKTCTEEEGSKLIAGDTCTLSNGCKIDESGFPDAKAPANSFCGNEGPGLCSEGYTCCFAAGDAKHPLGTYYCH